MSECHRPSRTSCPWRVGDIPECSAKQRLVSACDIVEACNTAGPPLKIPNTQKDAKEPFTLIPQPCLRVVDGACKAYTLPAIKWKTGQCPLRTTTVAKEEEGRKINPLKASKRAAAKKV